MKIPLRLRLRYLYVRLRLGKEGRKMADQIERDLDRALLLGKDYVLRGGDRYE